jgi:hypothetical protein
MMIKPTVERSPAQVRCDATPIEFGGTTLERIPVLALPTLRKFLATTGVFAIVGPGLGGLPFVVLFGLGGTDNLEMGTVTGGFLFAYLFGLYPALATGMVSSFLNQRSGRRSCWFSGSIGFLAASIFGVLLSCDNGNLVPMHVKLGEAAVFLGLPGLLGGFLTAWLVGRIAIWRGQ